MQKYNRHLLIGVIFLFGLIGCNSTPKDTGVARDSDNTPAPESVVAPAAEPLNLTVMSYNIHHGEGTDGVFDLRRLAVVIKSVDPDLVALQEVDSKTTRASGVDQAAELARLTDMHYVFGNAIDFAGGEYGEAILSRYPILESSNLHLPFTEGHERRSALAVIVQPTGFDQPIQFVGTHWAHDREDDRIAQARTTDQFFGMAEPDAPNNAPAKVAFTMLAGDLNAEPGSDPLRVLEPRWRSLNAASRFGAPFTYPSDDPTKAIDHLYLTPSAFKIFVESTEVLDEKIASDHRPLVVRLLAY